MKKNFFCPAAGIALTSLLLLKAFTLLHAVQPCLTLPGWNLPARLLQDVLRLSPFG